MTKSERITDILTRSGVNVRNVNVIGSFVHIDTFEKYEAKLIDLMTTCGFRFRRSSNGIHLSGLEGFRMIFIVT